MDTTLIRLIAHLSLFCLITTGMSTIWLARHKPLGLSEIPHSRLAIAALGLLAAWLLMLAVSLGGLHWVPRETLVTPLALTELGASALGWAWWLMAVRRTFRVERKSKNGNGAYA